MSSSSSPLVCPVCVHIFTRTRTSIIDTMVAQHLVHIYAMAAVYLSVNWHDLFTCM
jgi:hypothetical protein